MESDIMWQNISLNICDLMAWHMIQKRGDTVHNLEQGHLHGLHYVAPYQMLNQRIGWHSHRWNAEQHSGPQSET